MLTLLIPLALLWKTDINLCLSKLLKEYYIKGQDLKTGSSFGQRSLSSLSHGTCFPAQWHLTQATCFTSVNLPPRPSRHLLLAEQEEPPGIWSLSLLNACFIPLDRISFTKLGWHYFTCHLDLYINMYIYMCVYI